MHGANDSDAFVSSGIGLPLGGTIVVASDGTHDSDNALRVSLELGRKHGVDVQVISVVESTDFVEYEGSAPAEVERATRLAIASRDGELTAQRLRTGLADCSVSSTIVLGCRVDEILRFAADHDAVVIVTGEGSRGVLTRLFNRHTVMRLAAVTSIPVIAVPSDGLSLGDQRLFSLSPVSSDARL
jgi:nucleotide-binding universal stress UspA family protein